MTDTVRLGLAGLGWWGRVLAQAAVGAGAEIAGGFARTAATRESFTTEFGGRAFESYQAMLDDPGVDGVLLATPHSTHADQIVLAANAGKHVFVEKPFTLTVADGKRAMSAAEEAGVVLQVGHDRRRQPANRQLKRMIDAGELGTVIMVETNQSVPNALRFEPGYWRANRTESPLGGMTSLGVHMLDTMTYLLGRVERVFAFTRGILDAPPIDHATAIVLEFASGPLGYLGTSFVVPKTTSVTVRGTRGMAINDENGTRFYRQAVDETSRVEEPIEVLDTIVDQLGEFVRSIQGGAVPETGGAQGLEVIAVLEAAVASSESGRAESVSDFR
jgi:predicted dehydrogenase